MKKINIIILIIWMILIFSFSQDSGGASSKKSDGIAHLMVNFISEVTGKDFNGSTLEDTLNICIFIVRKSAHFLEYFILGLLIIRVLKDYKILNINICLYGIVFCFLYACSDEIHQLFVPNRSGRIIDVFIDTSGSILSIFLYYKYYLFKNKKCSSLKTT